MRRLVLFSLPPPRLRWMPRRCCASLRIPSVQFAAPRSQTHEDLAYAPCPICGRITHMCDMLTHLTTAHRELSQSHCRKICSERLALYEKVIGVPLKKIELTTSGRRVLDFLPTVLPTGYICNWCDRRSEVYPTRDKFLRHVADVHAEIDLEDVEQHVPLLPRGPQDETNNTRDEMRPTRRLAGVEVVAEKCPLPVGAPRQVGISVPRNLDRPIPPPPPPRSTTTVSSSVTNTTTTTTTTATNIINSTVSATAMKELVFTDTEFPCELCGKTFQSELDLLQHLETRHPDGTAVGAADVDQAAIADVAQFSAKEATKGADQRIHVICDLCPSSSKVYTIPSALFSHIRFKHPAEDAAYHVDRLIRMQKEAPSFVCKVCKKAFASASALDGHFKSKHADQVDTTTGQGRVSMSNCWWCHDCEKGFSSPKGLYGHMLSKHGLSTQAHPCPACKRVFADVYSLEEHITQQHKTIHLTDVGLQTHARCVTCDRCFLSHEDLHRHAVKHHKKDPRAPVRTFDSSPKQSVVSKEEAKPVEATPQAPRKVQRRKKTTTTTTTEAATATAD
ncbi:Zn-finger protein [Trypanosoma theileri]|uniref:Zn-finger protein n=1 Tax=Trypanosoma theileri TaxID=67003 RepID=A0A1X0P2C9_9TRYP|nr:Zn-finger protein [Trypanosoma theileri]ORC91062.1 Zn-finger protein [Trypanosoma theileri]